MNTLGIKTIATLLMALTGLSLWAQDQGKIWVTIENPADIPVESNGHLVSSNSEVQQLINSYDIFRAEQIISNSKQEHLLKVYELECNCDGDVLANDIRTSEGPFSKPERAPVYELLNTPDDYHMAFNTDYALDLIRAEKAWKHSIGDSNTVIGISDGNFYINHEEIQGQYTYYDSNNNSPYYYHGTAVAVTASGKTNNGVGKSSIGYNCRLSLIGMNYNKVLELSQNGVRVINMSWSSGCYYSQYIQDIVTEVYNNGTILVAAAGNGVTCGGPTHYVYPAAFDHVIAVSSIGPQDNHERTIGDPTTTHQHNSSVDICAPGYDVALTIGPGQYYTGNGTSFASPYVAGTIGLMLSARPCMTFEEVLLTLKETAKNIDGLNPAYAGELGAGRLDAGKALKRTLEYNCSDLGPGYMNNPTTVNDDNGATISDNEINGDTASNQTNTAGIDEEQETISVQMFPNPTRGVTRIRLEAANEMTLKVVDLNGALVSEQTIAPGAQTVNINLENQGVFFVHLEEQGNHYWSGKLVRL